ncbi:MAG: type II toxin-antitoxin system HicB family antitoxin [Planctomycetota bacterium]|nr:type II toxin-antitoxin system HicB family antitoxin [Planctomycetota bacterium]
MREFDVIIEQDDEGWFIAHVPALRGCHTQAATLVELKSRLREAIGACLADDAENGNPDGVHFVGVEKLAVAV